MVINQNLTLDDLPKEDYLQLQTWIKAEKILPDISEKELKMFLHSCIYDIEMTKKTLLAYYSLRIKSPDLFADRDPNSRQIVNVTKHVYGCFSPNTTKEGYMIFLTGIYEQNDLSDFVFTDVLKKNLMAIDLAISEQDEFCPGLAVVIDVGNLSFAHLRKIHIDGLGKLITYLQDALPVRLKKLFLLNVSTTFNILLNMINPLLNSRMKEIMCKCTRDDTSYFQTIPPETLPEEFGGTNGTLLDMQQTTLNKMNEHKEWFTEQTEIIQRLALSSNSGDERKRSFFGMRF